VPGELMMRYSFAIRFSCVIAISPEARSKPSTRQIGAVICCALVYPMTGERELATR